MGNINMEENKMDGEKGSSGTECCLSKIEKLAVPARVALMQSINICVDDSGAFVHCTNNRCGGSNVCKGSGTGTVGEHGKAITASSIMDITGAWCNKFGKEQLKATLTDVQYNPISDLFSIEKAIDWKLSGDQGGLILIKVFDIKIMPKNRVIFYAYLWREYEIAAILASTGTTTSIKKACMMTGHHDKE